MREAVIVSMVRTPVGRVGGALSSITAADLGALAIREAVRRAGIDPALIDDVIFGNILNNDWQNIARAAALAAGCAAALATAGACLTIYALVVARSAGRR